MSEIYQALKQEQRNRGEINDCGVIALSIVARVPYDIAHKKLQEQGRKERAGTYDSQLEKALKSLGFSYTVIMARKAIKRTNISKSRLIIPSRFASFYYKQRYTPKTIGKAYPNGTYLCFVNRHVFAMIDGQIHDWTEGRKHYINYIWEIAQ